MYLGKYIRKETEPMRAVTLGEKVSEDEVAKMNSRSPNVPVSFLQCSSLCEDIFPCCRAQEWSHDLL